MLKTDAMLRYSGGDARKLLNILELVISAEETDKIEITDQKVVDRLQENPAAYDKGGEMHYDIISAFIKSIRGSDPDGAIYWLARMVAGGEDPEFIARRLVISASEGGILSHSPTPSSKSSEHSANEAEPGGFPYVQPMPMHHLSPYKPNYF